MRRAFLITMFLSVSAFASDTGTTGANFTKLGVGARGLGLGEAYTAEASGVEALFWNPAGMVNAGRPTFMMTYNPIFEDTSHNQAAISFKKNSLAMGLGYNGVLYNAIKSYDDVGNRLEDYDAADHLGVLGLAFGNDRFSFGLNAKYVSSVIAKKTATTVAGEAGLLFVNPFIKNISHALTAKNVGNKISYIDQEDDLPSSYIFGNSIKIGSKLTLLLDAGLVKGTGGVGSGGVEWNVVGDRMKGFALRGGYTTKRNEADGLSGLSAGVGFSFGSVMLDYAWVPYGELGNGHAVSLIWTLPQIKKRAPRARPAAKDPVKTPSRLQGAAVTLELIDGQKMWGEILQETDDGYLFRSGNQTTAILKRDVIRVEPMDVPADENQDLPR